MNCHDLARVARIQRDHPGWTWDECEEHAHLTADEYEADRLAALGASDE